MRSLLVVAVAALLAGCGGGEPDRVTVDLLRDGTLEPVGTVVLEADGDRTRVDIGAPGLDAAAAPALRGGTCVELRPRDYKLAEFRDKRSVTELDVRFDILLARELKVTVSGRASTPHAIAACSQLPFDGEEKPLVVADLLAADGIDTRGLAWIEEGQAGRTRVGVLVFDVVEGPEPARIVRGGCKGETVHELTDLRDSESVTEVEAPLDSLTAGFWVVAGRLCGQIQPAS